MVPWWLPRCRALCRDGAPAGLAVGPGRAYAGGMLGFWQQQAFPFPLGQRFARVSVVEMGPLRCQSATTAMLVLTKPWTYSAWQKLWLEH